MGIGDWGLGFWGVGGWGGGGGPRTPPQQPTHTPPTPNNPKKYFVFIKIIKK